MTLQYNDSLQKLLHDEAPPGASRVIIEGIIKQFPQANHKTSIRVWKSPFVMVSHMTTERRNRTVLVPGRKAALWRFFFKWRQRLYSKLPYRIGKRYKWEYLNRLPEVFKWSVDGFDRHRAYFKQEYVVSNDNRSQVDMVRYGISGQKDYPSFATWNYTWAMAYVPEQDALYINLPPAGLY